jgi:hypothetical protein
MSGRVPSGGWMWIWRRYHGHIVAHVAHTDDNPRYRISVGSEPGEQASL